ncbi:hypothetical protein ES702_01993 [subsurface metagenome]
MKKKYLIKIAYRNGATAQSDKSYQCKISVGRPGFMDYGFISMPIQSWEQREGNSPVLEVQELKDNEGNLAFLNIRILKWEGSIPGAILVNDHVIWPLEELRSGRIQNSVGMTRKVPAKLFQPVEPQSVHTL